jgi:hypothetical protein
MASDVAKLCLRTQVSKEGDTGKLLPFMRIRWSRTEIEKREGSIWDRTIKTRGKEVQKPQERELHDNITSKL